MTEKQLMAWVIDVAKLGGWMVYHTFNSRRSVAGFPDLVLIRGQELLAVELKVGTNQPTDAQMDWLTAFAGVRKVEAMVVRPIEDSGIDRVSERLLARPA